MTAIIPLFLISIALYGICILITAFGRLGMSGLNKSLSSCPILFQLYSKEIEAKSSFIFFNMLINVSIISRCSFIVGSSNHFIISLDIIYFFSLMMLIFYHAFKISKPLLLR